MFYSINFLNVCCKCTVLQIEKRNLITIPQMSTKREKKLNSEVTQSPQTFNPHKIQHKHKPNTKPEMSIFLAPPQPHAKQP